MISYGICPSVSDLTSLNMIISTSIHVAANDIKEKVLFFFFFFLGQAAWHAGS